MRAHLSIVAVLLGVYVHMEASQAAHWQALLRQRGAWSWPQATVGQEAVLGAQASEEIAASPRGAAGTTWDWSWRDLQALPGIGPRRASLIVEARHIDAYARSLHAKERRGAPASAAIPSIDSAALAAGVEVHRVGFEALGFAGAEVAGVPVAGARRKRAEAQGARANRDLADSTPSGPTPPEEARTRTAPPIRAWTEPTSARAWRSFGPELLECLPGIGPATVAALRLHWRSAEAPRARGPRAPLDGRRRPDAPVEYTPPPARPP